jgi:NarL family two-component system response regulator LiaR
MMTHECSLRPIRVLLVDDHVVLRDGLAALVAGQADLEVVGTASTAAAALRLATELEPDVVVLDLQLPDGNGIQVARALGQRYPALRVLVLTAHDHPQYVRAARRVGVAGFLLKETAASRVLEALRIVARGGTVFDPYVGAIAARAPAAGTLIEPLSERELEVLHRLATGATNDEIARQLGISSRTVAVHVGAVMSKLDACSRTQAVAMAAHLGLISL